MSAIQNTQLVLALVEELKLQSVGQIIIGEKKAEVLIHDVHEFYRVFQSREYKEVPIADSEYFVSRVTTEIDGVTLVAYKRASEVGAAS